MKTYLRKGGKYQGEKRNKARAVGGIHAGAGTPLKGLQPVEESMPEQRKQVEGKSSGR